MGSVRVHAVNCKYLLVETGESRVELSNSTVVFVGSAKEGGERDLDEVLGVLESRSRKRVVVYVCLSEKWESSPDALRVGREILEHMAHRGFECSLVEPSPRRKMVLVPCADYLVVDAVVH